jgi:transcriptional regulator GlxA family with amidase domain
LRHDLILEVAAEHHLVTGSVAFDHRVEPDASSIALWRASVAGAVHALQADGPASLVWHEAQRDVVRSLLHLYHFRADALPIGSSTHSEHRLRAAVEYIHEHAAERLVVQDIADAAGLSIRGLQDAFHRTLDRAPLTYLREVRLTRVHEELRTLDPVTTHISDVARRWGFSHMGRFSAAYAEHFGEYPRQTLRRE